MMTHWQVWLCVSVFSKQLYRVDRKPAKHTCGAKNLLYVPALGRAQQATKKSISHTVPRNDDYGGCQAVCFKQSREVAVVSGDVVGVDPSITRTLPHCSLFFPWQQQSPCQRSWGAAGLVVHKVFCSCHVPSHEVARGSSEGA
jgi:hypothetical protein